MEFYRSATKAVLASLALTSTFISQCTEDLPNDCKCFPGDDCWPTPEEWSEFNSTIDGKLIATVPLAAPCHDDAWGTYDNASCAELRTSWVDPETQ